MGPPLLVSIMPFLGFTIGKNLICREKKFDMMKGSFRYANYWLVLNAITSGAKTKVIESLVLETYGEVDRFGSHKRVIPLGNSMNDLVSACGKVISAKLKPDAVEVQVVEAMDDQKASLKGYFVNADDDIESFAKLGQVSSWSTKKQQLDCLSSGKNLSLPSKEFRRVYTDSCISGIVSGQPERLKENFPLDGKNIDSGLTGRLAYYSSGLEYEANGPYDEQITKDAYQNIMDMYGDDTIREVSFNDTDVDEIWGNKREAFKRLEKMNSDVANKMRAKFRDLAVSMSMIRGCIEKGVKTTVSSAFQSNGFDFDEKEDDMAAWNKELKDHNDHTVIEGFDASEYFFGFYDFLCDCFYNYLIDISGAQIYKNLEDRMLCCLYDANAEMVLSLADIRKETDAVSGKEYHEFRTVQESLEAKGLIDIEETSTKKKKYVKLTKRGINFVEQKIRK